jgi:lysophospholipase L1-like esterase
MKRIVLCLLVVVFVSSLEAKSRVYLYGDGSMGVEDPVMIGWGDGLNAYLSKGIMLQNEAKEGLSLKAFLESDGEKKLSELPAKSIVFFQFGANDLNDGNPEQYSTLDSFVRQYQTLIKVALDNRLQVVLCTPLAQPYYREGVLIDRLGGYDDAVRRLAKYYYLPLLDMEMLTRSWWASMSEADVATYAAISLSVDAFLLTETGAQEVAKMAAEAIKLIKHGKVGKIIKK